jgi:hypothetical protein
MRRRGFSPYGPSKPALPHDEGIARDILPRDATRLCRRSGQKAV